ncbi:456_t:CDS:2 [Paraglomus brasilianum]|uniref:456_t:CDS:1 n=1 Tax=Paraglomus brasilianum TaxID=144538 RepID=A0A9N9D7T5_9GLOM|nr:456_t:CDS:2 [Paraglomus brasilianum]
MAEQSPLLGKDGFKITVERSSQYLMMRNMKAGWQYIIRRFIEGGGTILDLEYLNDERGRRIAAFGFHAGFAGAAIGLDVWARQCLHRGQEYPSIDPYPNEDELVNNIKYSLDAAGKRTTMILFLTLVTLASQQSPSQQGHYQLKKPRILDMSAILFKRLFEILRVKLQLLPEDEWHKG